MEGKLCHNIESGDEFYTHMFRVKEDNKEYNKEDNNVFFITLDDKEGKSILITSFFILLFSLFFLKLFSYLFLFLLFITFTIFIYYINITFIFKIIKYNHLI